MTPYWFHSEYIFDEDLNVTYKAVDFNGNEADECHVQFRVVGKFYIKMCSVVSKSSH